ncbi:MAG: monovalent cation/H+ antiporter complex subunit F [Peptococcia bacterium]|jgi:multicomponent Na+:H+ antiporter subunit F
MITDKLLTVFLLALVFIVFLMLFRVLKGPTVFDRLNGLGVIGTDTIVILILIGFLEKRVDMYIDIAISYGVLGFISLVVIAKYFEGKGDVNQ